MSREEAGMVHIFAVCCIINKPKVLPVPAGSAFLLLKILLYPSLYRVHSAKWFWFDSLAFLVIQRTVYFHFLISSSLWLICFFTSTLFLEYVMLLFAFTLHSYYCSHWCPICIPAFLLALFFLCNLLCFSEGGCETISIWIMLDIIFFFDKRTLTSWNMQIVFGKTRGIGGTEIC